MDIAEIKGASYPETNYSDSLIIENEDQPSSGEETDEKHIIRWKMICQWFEARNIKQGFPETIKQEAKLKAIKAKGTLSLIEDSIHEKFEKFRNRKFSVN